MLRIGLTGGIGSGKSAAAAEFARLGVPVIDADRTAREVVTPGQPALADIAAAFGPQFLDAGGGLRRAALRDHVFADPARRRRLEAILHPRIRAAMTAQADALQAPYCILVIPLLLEAGQTDMVDRILVVDVPEELQYRRVAARDGLDRERIAAIIAAQVDRATRLARADDVLRNDTDPATLRARVEELHRQYLALAAGTTP